jgi:competence protein CoiA
VKFALVDDKREEAVKGAKGVCPLCASEVIAKCGEKKIHHWAHKSKTSCDTWWENETEWHRSWKNKFPVEWQEVIRRDSSGEKHIADIETQTEWVIEFQHSYLKPDERRSRNAFYKKLAWVVDGTRRKTDIPQFQNTLDQSAVLWKEPLILRGPFPEECRLLKEWCSESNALVFFDFQKAKAEKQTKLWFRFPKMTTNIVYLALFSREDFVKLHNTDQFDEVVKNKIIPIQEILAQYEQNKRW